MPNRPSDGEGVPPPEEQHIDGQPTHDELVVQLEESDQSETVPNAELIRHIEMYSRYTPVFRSFAHTVIGAIYVPIIILFVLYELYPSFELDKLPGALSRGLGEACMPLFVGLILSRGLHSKGLAERYFGWSPTLCSALVKTVDTIIWVWLPLRVVYVGLETFEGGKWNDSLGRLLFITAMIATTIALVFTGRGLKEWVRERGQQQQERRWFAGIRSLFFWTLPLFPASLIVLSSAGYHFAASEMGWRLLWSVLFVIGISMLNGLVSRLLLIAQFGIKLRQLDRNEAGEFEQDAAIDIRAISLQVDRLLQATGLVIIVLFGWQLWSNVLPAMNYLDEVHLWQSATNVVDGVKEWITLRHLLMAMGIGVITIILSRNLPGLLEITLLDRLPLDRGGRYAISFVLKYLVAIAGFMLACQIIGFSWTSVQWLAGGLMVGLGFGLQEIFANVVSGIIILIERPIRVGDVVTVNNVTGTVTSMQLRATTIKDLDFRELIVPNKKFITEDIMNWTLTDRRSRIVHNIGVAYGSDTRLVEETLLKVAKRHPLVQVEPPPDVYFKEFGDSTLNFQLRVFIPSREIFAKVQHELNMAIDTEFRKKKIEIAFPQQDIYIKNLEDFPTAGSNGPSGKSPDWSTLQPPTSTQTPTSGGPKAYSDSEVQSESSSPMDQADASDRANETEQPTLPAANINLGDDGNNAPSDHRNVIPLPLKKLKGKQGVVFNERKKKSG